MTTWARWWRGTVEETLNTMLDAEADQLCGAGRYERTEGRKDTWAESYKRSLDTKAGSVKLRDTQAAQVNPRDSHHRTIPSAVRAAFGALPARKLTPKPACSISAPGIRMPGLPGGFPAIRQDRNLWCRWIGKGGLRPGYSVVEALNWYSYTSNNPIKYVDPTGEEAISGLALVITYGVLAIISWIVVDEVVDAAGDIADALTDLPVLASLPSDEQSGGRRSKLKSDA